MYDVVAVGECLIDMTAVGANEQGATLYAANPGGAPANVLAMLARLGAKTAMLGKIGADLFGAEMQQTFLRLGVDTAGLVEDAAHNTTLAFVQLTPEGERAFSFFRKQSADRMLQPADLRQDMLRSCHICHFGAVALTEEPARSATWEAVRIAREAGALLSFDPNYRDSLWLDRDTALAQIQRGIGAADLVKISREELELLYGSSDAEAGTAKLLAAGVSLAVVSLGEKGAFYRTPSSYGIVEAQPVKPLDTTGAGDAFWGALLFGLCPLDKETMRTLAAAEWQRILAFANAAGSLTTLAYGVIPALPDEAAIKAFQNARQQSAYQLGNTITKGVL